MIKKNNLRKIIALVLLPIITVGLLFIYNKNKVNEIYAVDPLIVTYDGGPPPDPVFEVTNMLPGDEVEKEFNVKNDSPQSEEVLMKGIKDTETEEFADILEIIVGEVGGPDIFGGTTGFKTLEDFFAVGDISLGNFPAGTDKSYRVKVKFPSSSGNEYQNALVIFDIIWKTDLPPIELPPECEELEGIITKVVEGTPGNDHIHGSVASELILAYEGNDKVDASSGHDCVVLGDGNDQVDSESGNDIVIGGEGNDNIDTGSGNDKVYGGPGNDDIRTGSGTDYVEGGSGNDTIRGGSDVDTLYGNEGNDNMRGNSGNDFLDGGPDTDVLNGNAGTDTCVNGETLNSCEL